jgi:hypothetical protein
MAFIEDKGTGLMRDINTINLQDWPLPDNFLTEFGRISVLWGKLENLICNTVTHFAGFRDLSDPRVYALLAENTINTDLEHLARLCHVLSPQHPGLEGYQSLIARIKDLQAQVNRLMTSELSKDPTSGQIMISVASPRHPFKRQFKPLELTELRTLALNIDGAQHDLYKLSTMLEQPISTWMLY